MSEFEPREFTDILEASEYCGRAQVATGGDWRIFQDEANGPFIVRLAPRMDLE